jgi:hypothetical protein
VRRSEGCRNRMIFLWQQLALVSRIYLAQRRDGDGCIWPQNEFTSRKRSDRLAAESSRVPTCMTLALHKSPQGMSCLAHSYFPFGVPYSSVSRSVACIRAPRLTLDLFLPFVEPQSREFASLFAKRQDSESLAAGMSAAPPTIALTDLRSCLGTSAPLVPQLFDRGWQMRQSRIRKSARRYCTLSTRDFSALIFGHLFL